MSFAGSLPLVYFDILVAIGANLFRDVFYVKARGRRDTLLPLSQSNDHFH